MKNLLPIATVFIALLAIVGTYRIQSQIQQIQMEIDALHGVDSMLGASVSTTASSDTLETFRTNVNADLAALASDNVSTTTAYTWTALQTFSASASSTLFSSNSAEVGGSATTTLTNAGRVGIASSSPFTYLGLGTSSATTTVSGGKFCMYFTDETGRGMWIKLSISGSTVLSTSTTACNN